MTAKRWGAAVLAAVALAACGSSDSGDISVRTTLPGATSTTVAAAAAAAANPTSTAVGGTPVTASADCQASFRQGHDNEAAGMETFAAFRPSVLRCESLAEWTAAAKGIGVNLGGQEPVFVDRTCSMADAATKARPICQEVKGKDS